MNKYKIIAYKADLHPYYNEKYIEGHAQVLKDYGVSNISSYKHSWKDNPGVYCVIALDQSDTIIGGVRFHISDWINPLPLEVALRDMDPKIVDFVQSFGQNNVGELCGLWNAKKVAGYGISMILTCAGISISNQVKVGMLLGICADYTLPMFKSVGFEVDNSLGNNGEFPYPTDKYITRVIGILNARSLSTATEENKEKIKFLRKNPECEVEEAGKKGNLLIDYNLIV